MVISKDGKRKRKEPPILELSPEVPKRIKVHAQRKFAQGQSGPSSSYSSVPIGFSFAQQSTPVKESREPPPELITHKRPNPDDFIEFLCYNDKSRLPPHLDFFNSNADNSTNYSVPSGSKAQSTETTSSSKNNLQKSHKETNKKPTGFMPFAVRKRAENVPDGKHRDKVQALRKKYHNQRMAKLKIKSLNKNGTNSGIPDTSKIEEEKPIEKKKNLKKVIEVIGKKGLRSSGPSEIAVVVTPKKEIKVVLKKEVLTTKKTDPPIKVKKTKKFKKKSIKPKTNLPRLTRQMIQKNPSLNKESDNEIEDFSSEDDQPLAIIKKTTNSIPDLPKITRSKKIYKTVIPVGRPKKFKNQNRSVPTPTSTSSDSKKNLNRKITRLTDVTKVHRSDSDGLSDEKIIKIKKTVKKIEPKPKDSSEEESTKKSLIKKKSSRKRRSGDLSQTDVSENETKTARPTRKTKEAATIYMELIGRKLNLKETDFDEDAMSLDSFPELPNVRKSTQMENQLKANYDKEKNKPPTKMEKKVGRPKKTDPESEKKIKIIKKNFSDSDEEPLAIKIVKQKLDEKKEIPPTITITEPVDFFTKLPTIISPVKGVQLSTSPIKSKILDQSFSSTIKTDELNSTKVNKSSENNSPVKIKIDIEDSPKSIEKKESICSTRELMNPLPSQEESGKIFGIASVSLAQSSGPLDTKCTLGKCGSIHKPPLGPVVPTETVLGDNQTTSRDRRKAKVNMTHEQIQKWLIDSSCAPDPDHMHDDLFDEEFDLKTPPKPISYLSAPSPFREDEPSTSSQKSKHFVNKSIPKGPTLRATPVLVKEENKEKDETKYSKTFSPYKEPKKIEIKTEYLPVPVPPPNPIAEIIKLPVSNPVPAPSTSADRKQPIYNQKRIPVYNTKPIETPKKKSVLNSFGAFSPDNETSIYSFDKEDDVVPVARPFRRQSQRQDDDVKSPKFQRPNDQTSTPTKQNIQPEVSLTLSPEDNTKSIEVQGSLDEPLNKKKKITEKEANDENSSDSEGHTFYIPLQSGNTGGGKSDNQIIQGVTVKLGTEGPEGPNQRVIMHAKLVTKTQKGSTSTPLPESMGDLVKNMIINKESSTTKSLQTKLPSTAASSSSELLRVNSNSSIVSQKSKTQQKPRTKDDSPIQASNNTAFPRRDDPAQMVEAPVFRPTEKEFQDPLEFIDRITPVAARFGLCKIIPPASFKPECRVADDMRFTAVNQYIHKLLHRWGPSTKELCAIRKYLATQSITMTRPPWIGGMEVDLPRLYHTVQELGGLKEVIEKKKWSRVSEDMCIPKAAHDRVTKLDDIYCKYLLPYDTLSPAERQKLFDDVEADWAKREAKARHNAARRVSIENDESEEDDDSEESEGDTMECTIKGRSMPLNQFFRIARNTMALWFKNLSPTTSDIEAEFWRHVAVRDSHVCVHAGSIDSSGWGYGFPAPGPKTKSSPCAKHPWNLKVLTNNSGSVLRSLGPVMGVTVPTLHVGMLFTACCWYKDPHGLPWIEYLHTGASKIWYGVPDDQSDNLREALINLVPTYCRNKTIWLPCDTAMVPPHMLTDRGVSLCRIEQQPGEFVVVFPRAYTSSVGTGYTVSESVSFATSNWLTSAQQDFKDIRESCEPAQFSLEQLIFSVASDTRTTPDIILEIIPMMSEFYEKELNFRNQLKAAGVTTMQKLPCPKSRKNVSEENECDVCSANLYISMIKVDEEVTYCLQHAVRYLNNSRIKPKQCKLVYTYGLEEIQQMIENLKEKATTQKNKIQNKKNAQQQVSRFNNLPTMLDK